MSDEQPRLWHAILTWFLVATAGIAIIAVLFVLTAGTIGLALAVGCAIFFTVALQYLIWGWWLGPAIARDVAAEEEENE